MKLISAKDAASKVQNLQQSRKDAIARIEQNYKELAKGYQQIVNDIDFDQTYVPQTRWEKFATKIRPYVDPSVTDTINTLIKSAVLRGRVQISINLDSLHPVVQQADGSLTYLSDIQNALIEQAERQDEYYGLQIQTHNLIAGHFENNVRQMTNQALADKLVSEIEKNPGYSVKIEQTNTLDAWPEWILTISWKETQD